jgi:hypothetical protein
MLQTKEYFSKHWKNNNTDDMPLAKVEGITTSEHDKLLS